jgi:predicted Fe-Mo cluster-binding NifX family protein
MKIAVPVANGQLSMHFGHCEEFAIMDVDPDRKVLLAKELVKAPPHQPGLLPAWLGEKGVNVVIAGGMGARAQALFAERGISVAIGAPSNSPEELAGSYLHGNLVTGANICDH